MTSKIYIILPVLVILLLFVGFFTSSETAYLSLPKIKIKNLVKQGVKNAKLVEKLKSNMDTLLTTVLIGTNFLNSLLSAIVTAFAIAIFGNSKLTNFVPFLTAFFITTFGQIIPKTAAGVYPEQFACFASKIISFLEKILFPIVWLFEKMSHLVVMIVEKILRPANSIITEEELKTLIDVGQSEGTIEKNEGRMLNKLISFNNVHAMDIMKHRNFVSMVEQNSTYSQVVQEFLTSGFSIITVYKESKQNVVGLIDYKKVLYAKLSLQTDLQGFAKSVMEEVIFIPGTLSVLEVLTKFRYSEHKFAIVLDEHGQTSGIITLQDIVRMVFGQMTDENSYINIPAEDKIQLISHNIFIVPGEIKIEDVNEILGLKLYSETCFTLAGWVLEQFGYLPNVGEVLYKDNKVFMIEDKHQQRITSIRIKTS